MLENLGALIGRLVAADPAAGITEQDAADLGLDSSELRSFMRARPGMAQQITDMAARFGVAPSEVTHPRWRALEIMHECRTCGHARSCGRLLDGRPDGRFDVSDCPNAGRYRDIVNER